MAVNYPIALSFVDPVEHHINYTFDRLIFLLNKRRVELLKYVRDTREDKRAVERERPETITQLTETQEQLHIDHRQNNLQSYKMRLIGKPECQKRETQLNISVEVQFLLKCVTRELEMSISSLGEILELPVYVPHYTTCHTSVVSTGKKGSAPGELYSPCAVVVHEETHQILVANCSNNSVEIFSETGEFFSQLGVRQLSYPRGITIHGNCVYVSCMGDHTVSKFSLTEMCRVSRIGCLGSNNGQFNLPRQLTTDTIGRIFIADNGNDRICIYDPDLNHLHNITLHSMSRPYDVKVSHDLLYVLSPTNNPCMHVLTIEGDVLHSIITCGKGMNVLQPLFFCLDLLNNFVLSDWDSYSIRVFSPKDILLCTIGRKEHQPGMSLNPMGVVITPNGKLISVLYDENYGLQIFY